MAHSIEELPEEVRPIIQYMPREMQQQVITDYETHYAPFLAMLAGWKGAVQSHFAQGQDSAVARLEEELFPLGDWRFPPQGLAVPSRAAERTIEVAFGAEMTDPARRPWITTGEGWMHPTALRAASFQWVDRNAVLAVDGDFVGNGRLEPLLERGQLAFVAVSEDVLCAMEQGEWWAKLPGQEYRPARLERYDGYMAFEREMQTARMNQRQFDLWLPPFHPYSRKIVCLRLAAAAEAGSQRADAPDMSWMPDLYNGFRFIGILRNPDRRAVAFLRSLDSRARTPLVQLNPVPVIQSAMQDNAFFPRFPRTESNEINLRMAGVFDLFGAVVYTDGAPIPAYMLRVPSNDPQAKVDDVEVRFAHVEPNVAMVKLYYGSVGQERPDGSDTPSSLEMTPVRFEVPYRVIGGATVRAPRARVPSAGESSRTEWMRKAWYYSVLRPPLLTQGDILEIIQHYTQGGLSNLINFRYSTREIIHQPDEGGTHWRSYLWPSVIARESHFDPRYEGIPTANYIPLIQSLRLSFGRGPAAGVVPDFLLTDAANYLASILSQYFVFSCFRVEGRLV
jgi:hypothetical protein